MLLVSCTSMPLCYRLLEYGNFSALSMPQEQEGYQIEEEELQIQPFDKQGEDYPDNQYAELSARYKVQAEQTGRAVFFFMASDSAQQKVQIRVNGTLITPTPLDPAKETQYEAALDRSGSGFLNDFSLHYHIPEPKEANNYPRITVTMKRANGLQLIHTSMKKCLDKGEDTYLWQATRKDKEQGFYWYFNKRLTPTEQFLLDIGPIGLGLVLICIVIVVHLYYLRQRNYTFWDVVGIPFLFCVLCNWMERFIRDFIGDHPPCAGQDNIWLFLFLPLMCVVYWPILEIAKKISRRVK